MLGLDTGSPSTEIGMSWIAPFFLLSFLTFWLIWVSSPAQAMSGLTFAMCCFSLLNWQGNRDQANQEYPGVLTSGADPTSGTGSRGCTEECRMRSGGMRDRHWDQYSQQGQLTATEPDSA